jgi:hypothetical protein
MSIELFHQVGHNWSWNRDAFVDDHCGDGLIMSPVHQARQHIENSSDLLRNASMFDPQFYLPNSQKPKLHTYDFFPEVVMGGFSTATFAVRALESARACLKFQMNMGFRQIVIPARFFDQMDPEYVEKQETFSVTAFLAVFKELNITKPIFLTLPLTSHMLESQKYRTGLLNWVTSFPEITGVYLFAANDRETKQPDSTAFLSAYLNFLRELRVVGLDLIVGYANTESLLFCLIDKIAITMGSFENTRIFSVDKFVSRDEDRRGPKARIYLPGLLNWVQFDQAKQIRALLPSLWPKIHFESTYAHDALKLTVEPTFNQPGLYKHYFLAFSDQVAQIRPLDPPKRADMLRDWISAAKNHNADIRRAGLELERHGADQHLEPWDKVIQGFNA